jgi:hypothetical protein
MASSRLPLTATASCHLVRRGYQIAINGLFMQWQDGTKVVL